MKINSGAIRRTLFRRKELYTMPGDRKAIKVRMKPDNTKNRETPV
jgi:hypothetical protein